MKFNFNLHQLLIGVQQKLDWSEHQASENVYLVIRLNSAILIHFLWCCMLTLPSHSSCVSTKILLPLL